MPQAIAPPPLLVTAVPSAALPPPADEAVRAVAVTLVAAAGLVWSGGGFEAAVAAGMTGFTAWLEATNASMALYKNKISSCKCGFSDQFSSDKARAYTANTHL